MTPLDLIPGKTPSRREFIGALASASLGAVAAPCVVSSAKPAAALRREYFDIHIHLVQQWFGNDHGPITAADALRWMDAHGIEHAAVLPLVSPEAFWYPISSEWVLSETKPHRDRLVPFCAIDPRTLETHLPEKQQIVDMLLRYRDAGARGLGEHKPRLPIDHPLCMRLYEACVAAELPVLFHLDNQACMDRPGLPGLAHALTEHPDLVMIGHGKGWWASIAGNVTQADLHVGYPTGSVAAGGAIDALMDRFPNLYGDLSSSGAHAVLRDPKFGAEFLRRRADRLLFGTDYYDRTQKDFLQFELFDRVEAPAEVRRKIGGANAHRLLKLS